MSSNIPASEQLNPLNGQAYSANYDILRKQSQELPVAQHMPQLLSTINEHNVVICTGATGSGKTTLLPAALLLQKPFLKSGKKIALTQPRVLAAESVSFSLQKVSA